MASQQTSNSCTRCLEEPGYLVNPRCLPCGHVYCEICFEAVSKTTESGLEIQCSHCGKTHTVPSFDGLASPQSDVNETHQNTEADNVTVLCSRCKKQGKENSAVCYCPECEEPFCAHDEQEHNKWCRRHKTIAISMYIKKPMLYKWPPCTEHQHELSMACVHCLKMYCTECIVGEDQCQDTQGHTVKPLGDIEVHLKKELSKMLSDRTLSLEKMARTEKQIWRVLDNMEINCKTMKQQVGKHTEKQIEQIKREACELITKIDSWYEDSKSSTEKYLQNLRSKRDELEMLIKSTRKFLHETHVSEIVRQKHERTESLQAATEPPSCVGESVHNQTLSDDQAPSSGALLSVKICNAPTLLEYKTSHNISLKCTAISYCTSQGLFFVAHEKGLRAFLSQFGCYKFQYPISYGRYRDTYTTAAMGCSANTVTSLAQETQSYANYVFYVGQQNGMETERSVCQQKLSHTANSPLFKFDCSSTTSSRLAVNDQFIVVSNPANDKTTMIVYSRQAKTQTTIELKHTPNGCRFMPNSNILIFSFESGIESYLLSDDGKLMELQWACDQAPDAHGLAVLSDGVILAHSPKHKVVYAVSKLGSLIAVFENEEIGKATAGDICVRESETDGKSIYLPSSTHQSIIQFMIVY